MRKSKAQSLAKLARSKSYILVTDSEAILDIHLEGPNKLNSYIECLSRLGVLDLMHDQLVEARNEYAQAAAAKFGIELEVDKPTKKPKAKATAKATGKGKDWVAPAKKKSSK